MEVNEMKTKIENIVGTIEQKRDYLREISLKERETLNEINTLDNEMVDLFTRLTQKAESVG